MSEYLIIDEYEKNVFQELEKWKNLEPSIFSKAYSTIFKPATWLIQKVVPESAIKGVLTGCNNLSNRGKYLTSY